VASAASDYSFTSPTISNATASIAARTLTPTLNNTGVSKVYDGNTSASIGFTPGYTFSGLIGGDSSASLSNTTTAYNSAHVANATTLNVSGLAINSISGSNSSAASDYVLDATSKSVVAGITTKAITSSASIGGALSKVYDGSTSASGATVSGSVAGGIATDTLTLDTGGETLAYNTAHALTANSIGASGTSTFNIGASLQHGTRIDGFANSSQR
jgi:hypothetical protein